MLTKVILTIQNIQLMIALGSMSSNLINCPRCHAVIQPVAVHGHYQCQICKSNIDDCCSGETCQPTIEMSTLKEEENNNSQVGK